MSLCNKLWFSNPYIFATQCRRPQIFQTMNSVRSNNISLKYQSFTLSGCIYIGIRKVRFVAKHQFLLKHFHMQFFPFLWIAGLSSYFHKTMMLKNLIIAGKFTMLRINYYAQPPNDWRKRTRFDATMIKQTLFKYRSYMKTKPSLLFYKPSQHSIIKFDACLEIPKFHLLKCWNGEIVYSTEVPRGIAWGRSCSSN